MLVIPPKFRYFQKLVRGNREDVHVGRGYLSRFKDSEDNFARVTVLTSVAEDGTVAVSEASFPCLRILA